MSPNGLVNLEKLNFLRWEGKGASTLETGTCGCFCPGYLPRSMIGAAAFCCLLDFRLTLLQHFGTHVKICLERINKCALLFFFFVTSLF